MNEGASARVEISGHALFLQPNGKRITGGYLRKHIAPIFKEITKDSSTILYDMRHPLQHISMTGRKISKRLPTA
jgi:hypothetical protein